MSLTSYIKTGAIPSIDASHSIVKSLVRLGMANTSGLLIILLKSTKAFSTNLSQQHNRFLFNNLVNGLIMAL